MPKFLIALLLIAISTQKLMALDFNTDNSNPQPITISCERLKESYPSIDCSEQSKKAAGRESSRVEVLIIEPQVEVIESTTEEESEWPPKATFDYTKNSAEINRLRIAARINNCLPIWDLPGIDLKYFGPWHIDISDLTGNKGDYIFICRSYADEFLFNVILLADSNRKIWRGCPTKAYAGTTVPYPLGLAVYTSENSSFHSREMAYWYTQDNKSGPAGVLPSDPVIDTAKHDSGVVLTCHEKVWYGYLYH